MTGQLGLLGAAHPALVAPPDLDPAARWQSCGQAAVAAITGRTLAAIRPHLPHEAGYMAPADMRATLDSLGFHVTERAYAWPARGLALIMFEGPWSDPALPAGAAMTRSHWIAVDRADGRGGGLVYDVNAPRPMFLEFWRRGFVTDLASSLHDRATGGWSLRLGLEIVARSI